MPSSPPAVPSHPVSYRGRSYPIGQCNNSYIFPGMGLGVLAVGARRVSDGMFMAAAEALGHCSPALKDPEAALLPPLDRARAVSSDIAFAVARQAQAEGLAEATSEEEVRRLIAVKRWRPLYRPYNAV